MPQTSYLTTPAAAYAGTPRGCGHKILARVADGAMVRGVACVRGSADKHVRALASSDAPANDADAIMTVQATATTAQTCTGATLDGDVGAAAFWPPRNVTCTLNSHADWDPSTIIVEGLGAFGEPVSETFEVPNGGNVTLTGVVAFSQVTAVKIPPQTGTNGTLDVGLGVKIGAIDRKVLGIVKYDETAEPAAIAQYDDVDVIEKGEVWVDAEEAVTEGDAVYVRLVVSGNEVYGAFRATPDANDCGLLRRARWASTTSGAGLAVVELL